eukprot:6586926-Karenia_brevis.AAC.1
METYPKGVTFEERERPSGEGEGKEYIENRDKVPRDFHISYKDAKKPGFTKGCPGCGSWFQKAGQAAA